MKRMLLFLCLLSVAKLQAQVCNGTWGKPIVSQTFGQGDNSAKFFGPLSKYAPGVTTSTTFILSGPSDNYSCLTQNANNGQASWVNVGDHTGDPNGLMLEINAPSSGGTIFVEYTMHDLCPNTVLQLSVWVLNVDGGGNINGRQSPNMTMKVIDSTTGAFLDSVNTGDVPFDALWHQYTMTFNNGNSSTVTLKFINNSVGSGFGNDLAIDDITVSPCVPLTHINPKTDTTVCLGTPMHFVANATGNVYHPAEYQWQYSRDAGATWVNAKPAGTDTTYDFIGAAAGTYWVRFLIGPTGFVANNNCSATSDMSTVKVLPMPSLSVTSPVVYCQNATAVKLTAKGTNIAWYTTDTGTVPLPDAPMPNTTSPDTTLYFVKGYVGSTCQSFDSVQVIVDPLPVVVATSNAPICVGDTLVLKANAVGQGVSYSWTGPGNFVAVGKEQTIFNATMAASGLYQVVASLNGCADSTYDTAHVQPLPNSSISPLSKQPRCSGDSLLLTINNYDPEYKYHWKPENLFANNNAKEVSGVVKNSGDIQLTTTDALGCTTMDKISVVVEQCCKLYMPNAFTPNGDGKNDVFRPITIGHFDDYKLIIVNRWGQTVFETTNIADPWDGILNGQLLSMDTYYYYVSYSCNGSTIEERGDVTLIR